MHDTCFVNIFDSLIPLIVLKVLKVKSYASFETHTLLDRSLRVLQLPVHPIKLTANG